VSEAVDVVLARQMIEQTLYRYSWLYDFEYARGIGVCFTDDVVGDFGPTTTHGRLEMVAELERRRTVQYAADEFTMHVNTNTLYRELTADYAATTTYCMFYVKKEGGRVWDRRSGGYYADAFQRVGAEWLIQRRQWMFGARL
jgi:hypothetical protein